MNSNALLLNYWRHIDVLDLRSDAVKSTAFKGILASPDTAFSLSDRYEAGVQVWDERSHRDISGSVETLLEGGDLRAYPEPFWLPTPQSGHLLCVSACSYWDSNRKEKKAPFDCSVYLVDLKAMKVVKRIPGKGIGPTADKRAVVTLRGKTISFVDLPDGPD
jgi:hypothetical protein